MDRAGTKPFSQELAGYAIGAAPTDIPIVARGGMESGGPEILLGQVRRHHAAFH